MMTGKYKCKLCGEIIEDVPDSLDYHLKMTHSIDLVELCRSNEWDSEAIYDEYYIKNV